MSNWKWHAASHRGRRETNEDSCLVLTHEHELFFAAVADGMGGVHGGQTASRLVLDSIHDFLLKRSAKGITGPQLKSVLGEIFAVSQQAIAGFIQKHLEWRGMGTTLACVLGSADACVTGNIGDSRVYWLHGGDLQQLTRDHTHIQDYIDTATQPLEKELLNRFSSMLTRSLDGGNDVPDIQPLDEPFLSISSGDAFLLCSDGLILDKSSRESKELRNYLVASASLKSAAQNLVAYAYNQGSQDNISVICASYGTLPREEKPIVCYPFPPAEQGKRKKRGLWIIVPLLICLLAATGVFLFGRRSSWIKKAAPTEPPTTINPTKPIPMPTEETRSANEDWGLNEDDFQEDSAPRSIKDKITWMKHANAESYTIRIFESKDSEPFICEEHCDSPPFYLGKIKNDLKGKKVYIELECTTVDGRTITDDKRLPLIIRK